MSSSRKAMLTAPPDMTPLRPRLEAPPGACDCHIHLFGPQDRYPFDAGADYLSVEQSAETYVALQERLGLGRAVIVSASAYGRDNRLMLDTLAAWPDRFRGVGVAADGIGDDELERMHRLGVRGIRYAAIRRYPNTAPLNPHVAARVAELGWHVQFLFEGYNIPDYKERLLALPNTVVIDHMGRLPAGEGVGHPAFRTLLEMLDTGKVWVKLSGPMRTSAEDRPPYRDVLPFVKALVAHSPERLVWGSDWPHVRYEGVMPNDATLLDLLLDWVPDEAVRNRILADNPATLYDFPKP